MAKAAYLDLFAGCSGDMLLGSILDAGVPLEQLAEKLAVLPLEGYRIIQKRVNRSALSSTLALVIDDMSNKQPERSFSDIERLISSSNLSKKVKKQAGTIFRSLGEAEAKVHGISLKDVHFHEVGAIDSIIDIVGTLIGFDLLGITDLFSSPFPVTDGYVECRHGVLPLPAPATLELISVTNAPVISPIHKGMERTELVTPTAAAIICSLAKFSRPPMNLEKIAYGAGNRDPSDYPNVLRLWIGEYQKETPSEKAVLLETNIDDMNPQIYEYVMDRLFKEGALDVWLTPIQMKKNRPAILLSVLAEEDAEPCMVKILMHETSTLGVRTRTVFRHIADREIIELNSSYGKVRVKVKRCDSKLLGMTPEYDDCRKVASEQGVPLKDVLSQIKSETYRKIN